MSLTTRSVIITSQTLQFSTESPEIVTADWTNLGPLTTTFRPPSSCFPTPPGGLEVDDYSDPDVGRVHRQACEIYNLQTPQWLDCQPSGPAFAPFWFGTSSTIHNSFYSPGFQCPSGYTSADVFVLNASNVSTASIQADALRVTGTHVFCCPRGYSSRFSRCVSTVSTATSTSLCNGYNFTTETVTTHTVGTPYRDDTLSTVTEELWTLPAGYFPGAFTWDPSQAAVTASEVILPVYMIHQGSDVPKDAGLSTPAKITIGVVVPVVVLLGIVVGTLCIMKRLKAPKSQSYEEPLDMQVLERRVKYKRPVTTRRNWNWI